MDLTEEQKALILENKGVISDLTELTNIVFPGEGNLDGRTKEGRAVRAFLLVMKSNMKQSMSILRKIFL